MSGTWYATLTGMHYIVADKKIRKREMMNSLEGRKHYVVFIRKYRNTDMYIEFLTILLRLECHDFLKKRSHYKYIFYKLDKSLH